MDVNKKKTTYVVSLLLLLILLLPPQKGSDREKGGETLPDFLTID